MTPQERQSLQLLLSQLTQVKGIAKDAEAERMIAEAVAQQPDAAYLLVQRTMILEQALNAAKEQIRELEARVNPSAAGGGSSSFLNANAWGNSGGSATGPARGQETSVTGRPLPGNAPEYGGAPVYPATQPPAASAGFGRGGMSGFLGGGGGSMLGTLAATAAGVAGGAFLFQGIENLLGHRGEHAANPLTGQQDALTDPLAKSSLFDEPSSGTDDSSQDSLFSDDNLSDDLFSDNSDFSDDSNEV
jgi:hypothetical protein